MRTRVVKSWIADEKDKRLSHTDERVDRYGWSSMTEQLWCVLASAHLLPTFNTRRKGTRPTNLFCARTDTQRKLLCLAHKEFLCSHNAVARCETVSSVFNASLYHNGVRYAELVKKAQADAQ